MNPGEWLHAVTDVITVLLLVGALPIAYGRGWQRGRRTVDPSKAAMHALRKEQATKTPLFGECGVTMHRWTCGRAAGHEGFHAYDKDGITATWSSNERSTPKFWEEA